MLSSARPPQLHSIMELKLKIFSFNNHLGVKFCRKNGVKVNSCVRFFFAISVKVLPLLVGHRSTLFVTILHTLPPKNSKTARSTKTPFFIGGSGLCATNTVVTLFSDKQCCPHFVAQKPSIFRKIIVFHFFSPKNNIFSIIEMYDSFIEIPWNSIRNVVVQLVGLKSLYIFGSPNLI